MPRAFIVAWGTQSHVNDAKRDKHQMQGFRACVTGSLFLLDLISDCLCSNGGFICRSVKPQMLFKLVIGRTQTHPLRKKPSKHSNVCPLTFLYSSIFVSPGHWDFIRWDFESFNSRGYCKYAQSSLAPILPPWCQCCGLWAQPDSSVGTSRLCWWGMYNSS